MKQFTEDKQDEYNDKIPILVKFQRELEDLYDKLRWLKMDIEKRIELSKSQETEIHFIT